MGSFIEARRSKCEPKIGTLCLTVRTAVVSFTQRAFSQPDIPNSHATANERRQRQAAIVLNNNRSSWGVPCVVLCIIVPCS